MDALRAEGRSEPWMKECRCHWMCLKAKHQLLFLTKNPESLWYTSTLWMMSFISDEFLKVISCHHFWYAVYGYTSWDQLPRWFPKASSFPFSLEPPWPKLTQGFKYLRWRYLLVPYFRAVLGGGGFPGLWLSSKRGRLKIFESEIQVGFWVFLEGWDGVAELFL